ncbi:CbrC family protein [Streptomyces sp. A244]|uniref:CbrC family protein n=1 Tax=Streptomyces sp. A244 TaxID=2137016 RepID=UPI0035C0731C
MVTTQELFPRWSIWPARFGSPASRLQLLVLDKLSRSAGPKGIRAAIFYTAHEVNGRFCRWCIADGCAAERFAGEFTDSYGLDGVSEDVLHEVTRRTLASTPGRTLPGRGRLRGRRRVHRTGGASRSPRPSAGRHVPRRLARREPA